MNKKIEELRTSQIREQIIAEVNHTLLTIRHGQRIGKEFIEKLIGETCEKYGYKPASHIEHIIFGMNVRDGFLKDLMRKLPPKSDVIKTNSK